MADEGEAPPPVEGEEAAPPTAEEPEAPAVEEAAPPAEPEVEAEVTAPPPEPEAAPEVAPEPEAAAAAPPEDSPPAPAAADEPAPVDAGTPAEATAAAPPKAEKDKPKRESPQSGAGVDSIDHMQVHPKSPSKIKNHEPWLKGTFRTAKGRIITGTELCQSLDRMYNAFAGKAFEPSGSAKTAPGMPTPKTMTASEIEDVVTRLYQTKAISEGDEGKLESVMLKFDEEGKETWVPTKSVSYDEQKSYLCELYQRCIDSKKKTHDELAAKYLQPLGKPRK